MSEVQNHNDAGTDNPPARPALAFEHSNALLVMTFIDPMKSRAMAGWLLGELRAPT